MLTLEHISWMVIDLQTHCHHSCFLFGLSTFTNANPAFAGCESTSKDTTQTTMHARTHARTHACAHTHTHGMYANMHMHAPIGTHVVPWLFEKGRRTRRACWHVSCSVSHVACCLAWLLRRKGRHIQQAAFQSP